MFLCLEKIITTGLKLKIRFIESSPVTVFLCFSSFLLICGQFINNNLFINTLNSNVRTLFETVQVILYAFRRKMHYSSVRLQLKFKNCNNGNPMPNAQYPKQKEEKIYHTTQITLLYTEEKDNIQRATEGPGLLIRNVYKAQIE